MSLSGQLELEKQILLILNTLLPRKYTWELKALLQIGTFDNGSSFSYKGTGVRKRKSEYFTAFICLNLMRRSSLQGTDCLRRLWYSILTFEMKYCEMNPKLFIWAPVPNIQKWVYFSFCLHKWRSILTMLILKGNCGTCYLVSVYL